NSPVQTYSSGMNVRLGFAIAAILIKPDILFLDEVLAVGDINFIIKCLNTVRELSRNSAVVFVSHNMQQISMFCTRVMVLEKGKILVDSQNPSDGIDRYFALLKSAQQISGTGKAEIISLELAVDNQLIKGTEPKLIQGADTTAILYFRIIESDCQAKVLLVVRDAAMSPILVFPLSQKDGEAICFSPGEYKLEIPLGNIDLNSGKYSFVVAVIDNDSQIIHARIEGICPFRVAANRHYWGDVIRPVAPRYCHLNLPER
ncbi:MAG: hypothetical protein IMY76_04985, partial [Chloroflexi bacterium]|nr:hypothetical protein [Chloroflexota bacterium]